MNDEMGCRPVAVVKTLIPEFDSDLAVTILGSDRGPPDLLYAEVANVLWTVHRRGGRTPDALTQAADLLSTPDIEIAATGPLAARALAHAVALDHPACDGFYLALAEQEGVPLVTADAGLQRKVHASAPAVRVLSLSEAISKL